MKTATTKIKGLEVSFEADEDQGTTQCWIVDGRMSASLEALKAEGVLTGNGPDLPIDQPTIDAIEAWAVAQGY